MSVLKCSLCGGDLFSPKHVHQASGTPVDHYFAARNLHEAQMAIDLISKSADRYYQLLLKYETADEIRRHE